MYNHVVPNSVRIANRLDLVPKLPLPPLYEHVLAASDLNPAQLLPLRPRVVVKGDLACEHALNSYLYLLSLQSGGAVIPLDPACAPRRASTGTNDGAR